MSVEARLAALLAPPEQQGWTQALVSSVDAVAGTAVVVPSRGTSTDTVTMRYALAHPPRPGSTVWVQSKAGDSLIVAQQAPEGSPGCAVRRSAALSLATGVQTTIGGLDTVEHDPWSMLDQTGQDRVIIPATGRYDVVGSLSFGGVAGGAYRDLRILVNGTLANVVRGAPIGANSLPVVAAANDLILNAGDYVQLSAFQDSGSSMAVGIASYTPRLAVSWRGHRLPAVAAGPELLTNPGFESGIGAGWSTFWAGGASWSDDTTTMHTGGHALKGVAAAAAVLGINATDVIPVAPGERYDLSAWVKTAVALPGTATQGVDLWLLCGPDAAGADYFQPGLVVAAAAQARATATSWSRLAGTVTIPAGCYSARLALRSYDLTGGHTVTWDDASMRKAATA